MMQAVRLIVKQAGVFTQELDDLLLAYRRERMPLILRERLENQHPTTCPNPIYRLHLSRRPQMH